MVTSNSSGPEYAAKALEEMTPRFSVHVHTAFCTGFRWEVANASGETVASGVEATARAARKTGNSWIRAHTDKREAPELVGMSGLADVRRRR